MGGAPKAPKPPPPPPPPEVSPNEDAARKKRESELNRSRRTASNSPGLSAADVSKQTLLGG